MRKEGEFNEWTETLVKSSYHLKYKPIVMGGGRWVERAEIFKVIYDPSVFFFSFKWQGAFEIL